MNSTFGSVCSGVEVASLVLKPLGLKPIWYSEIAEFPSYFLQEKYPETPNLGDMIGIPDKLRNGEIEAPDLLCGGTPCQAFSLAGNQNGLNDNRGQLTLKYSEIANEIDAIRKREGKGRAILFWENVEGILTDKTNAFGCFLADLAGLSEPITVKKWLSAGMIKGPERNIAWRVLDAKYFGIPQQRKRLYLLAGGKDFNPEDVLFEMGGRVKDVYKTETKANENPTLFDVDVEKSDKSGLTRSIEGNYVEVFRQYSDCLYAAYGTKWNGNAAAYNGSLYVSQNGRLRRLTPLECERLMGMPDNYTKMKVCSHTNRYQAIGNSWAVPVVDWILRRLIKEEHGSVTIDKMYLQTKPDYQIGQFGDILQMSTGESLNASPIPYSAIETNMLDIVDTNPDTVFYISSKGCAGILRRTDEHNIKINNRLRQVLTANA